jgi:hypothetical protein
VTLQVIIVTLGDFKFSWAEHREQRLRTLASHPSVDARVVPTLQRTQAISAFCKDERRSRRVVVQVTGRKAHMSREAKWMPYAGSVRGLE